MCVDRGRPLSKSLRIGREVVPYTIQNVCVTLSFPSSLPLTPPQPSFQCRAIRKVTISEGRKSLVCRHWIAVCEGQTVSWYNQAGCVNGMRQIVRGAKIDNTTGFPACWGFFLNVVVLVCYRASEIRFEYIFSNTVPQLKSAVFYRASNCRSMSA